MFTITLIIYLIGIVLVGGFVTILLINLTKPSEYPMFSKDSLIFMLVFGSIWPIIVTGIFILLILDTLEHIKGEI